MTNTMTNGGGVPQWTLADRIRKARDFAGLDQGDLAAVTGLSRQTLSNYEHGKTRASKASLKLIAMATGVDRYWLLTGHASGPDGTGDQQKASTICKTRTVAAA